jgi:two-component system, chemotaxis family, chemotaxis protein CheY
MTQADLSDVRVLVVEDNAFQRRILIRLLTTLKAGEVQQAADGAEALAMLEHFLPDIILTNSQMQPMGGLEFARRVRASEQRPFQTVPIIMLSAEDALSEAPVARSAGINAFLSKPVSPDVLGEQILNMIANPPPFVRSPAYVGPERRLSNDPYSGPERRRAEP